MLLPCSIQAMTKTKTSNAGSALIQTATGLFQSRWACWKKFYIYKLQIHVMLRPRYLLGHLFLLKRNAAFQWILKQTEDSHTARILFTIFSACLVSGNWSSPKNIEKTSRLSSTAKVGGCEKRLYIGIFPICGDVFPLHPGQIMGKSVRYYKCGKENWAEWKLR